ncbi:MAG: Rpn family recombination-promoting nuclease/putative transposase [Verrucomicrobiota bacterium]
MAEHSVHQPNDKLFRSTFSELENASAFFQNYLAADLVSSLDWRTLCQQPGSFIDAELAGSESDLLFSVSHQSCEVFVYILFEHQSREDPWMALRLLRYMLRIWEKQRSSADATRQKPSLSPIIPVVLAQGSEPWRTEPRFGALFGQGAPSAYTPDFAFELIQLVSIGYEEMRGSAAGVLSMRALRADALGELLHAMVFDETLLLRASESAVERLFRYISSRDLDRNDFRKNLNKLRNSDLKEKAMTLAEQWREEGREQGMESEAQRSVIDVLEIRFSRVPEGLAEKIRHEPNLAKLRSLHIQALQASSLEDFASHLEG